MPCIEQLGLNTGSVTSFKQCGSSSLHFKTNLWPLGPLDWTLYCQKNLSLCEDDLADVPPQSLSPPESRMF